MKIATISAVVLALTAASIAPLHAAANKGKSGGAPPKTTHAAGGSAARAPKTTVTHGKAAATRPVKSAPTTTTPKTHGQSHATETKQSKTTDSKRAATSTASTTATPTPSDTDTTTPPNPIAEKLQNKPLGTRIEGMLPKGMTLDTASAGFKNQGQFIAAVHVSQNLGIPFADLKATMLGTPLAGSTTSEPTSPMSLGQAIQRLKPFANATTEATRAETQATRDLQTSTTPTTSTATTSTSTSTSTMTRKSRTRGK